MPQHPAMLPTRTLTRMASMTTMTMPVTQTMPVSGSYYCVNPFLRFQFKKKPQ
jgi:hypothetical protein